MSEQDDPVIIACRIGDVSPWRTTQRRDVDRAHDYRCSNCGRKGHNRRTCKEPLL